LRTAFHSTQYRRNPVRAGWGFVAFVLWACSGLLLVGCAKPQPFVSEDRLQRGLVIVLPGIEGRSGFNEAICRGLNDGGVNWAIELYDWTSKWGPLHSLRGESRNREKAFAIASRVIRYQDSHPGRPVVLVGQSGGGAMAAWAAEALPSGRSVDGVIMLSPALSPRYMLDWSLGNSRRGIVNFYSPRDWIFLGVGTVVYGTMDGRHSESAGRIGFKVPSAGGRPRCYRKLYQVAWQQKMAETGHSGLHLTSGGWRFVMTYVAPFVLAETWDDELVASVLNRRQDDKLVSPPPPAKPAATAPTTAPTTAPQDASSTRPSSAPAR